MNKDILKKLGSRIIELRKQKGLSLEKLAWGSEIAKSTLSDIEKGISAPRYTTLLKIAGFLEVKVTHLINDEEAILFWQNNEQL